MGSELQRTLQGDLDAIANKSLEKDRNHRYETILNFVSDLENLLAGEQVSATQLSFYQKQWRMLNRYAFELAVISIFDSILSSFLNSQSRTDLHHSAVNRPASLRH